MASRDWWWKGRNESLKYRGLESGGDLAVQKDTVMMDTWSYVFLRTHRTYSTKSEALYMQILRNQFKWFQRTPQGRMQSRAQWPKCIKQPRWRDEEKAADWSNLRNVDFLRQKVKGIAYKHSTLVDKIVSQCRTG